DLHPETAELGEPVEDLVGDAGVALDLFAVDVGLGELTQPGQELLGVLTHLGLRPRIDEIHPQPAQEQLLANAGLAPFRFPRRLGHPAGLLRGAMPLRRAHLQDPWTSTGTWSDPHVTAQGYPTVATYSY